MLNQFQKNKKASSIKVNYFFNLIYQIFLLVVPIFVTPYIARVLGSDGSGAYAYTLSLSSYFSLFAALGFGYYSQRYIAKINNKKSLSISFWELFLAKFSSTLLTIILYIILVAFDVYGKSYNYLMEIMIINVFATGFDISFFYQGKEDFKKIVIRNVLIKCLSIISIFIFVKKSNDLWVYALIQCLTALISNLALWSYLPKDLSKVKIKELHPFRHIVPALLLFIPTVASTIYTTFDKTLLTLITKNDSLTGNFDYADKLVKMVLTVVSSLGIVMISRNSKLLKENNIEQLKKNINRTCQFVLAIGLPLTVGLILIANNLIPWYLGDEYIYVSNLLMIMSPLILIIGFSNILGLQYLIPSNQDKKFTFSICLGALINIVFSLFLIWLLGIYGAAIGSLISEITVTIAMFIYCRKVIDWKYLFKKSYKYLIAIIIMIIPCLFEALYFSSSILNTILIILTGAVVYGGVLIALKEDFALQCLQICLNTLKKIFNFLTKKIKKEKKMRILITGVNGQLGHDVLNELEKRNYKDIKGIDIQDLDITKEKDVHEYIKEYKPDIIIHNAAWTAVDKAEQMPEKVYEVNALGPKYIAEAAKEIGAKMMYISTDYVFNGKGKNYFEVNSPKNGLSVYGKTKSAGEDFVTSTLKEYWVIRISWVFGINGNNFIKTMLKLAKNGKKELNVVDDQIGSPTYTYDLAKLMCDMIETNKYGIYHATNEGICSWYEFAKYIFEVAGYNDIKVNPVSSIEYKKLVPNQADRPLNSRMSKRSLDEAGFKRLPSWQDATKRYIEELKKKGEF